MINKQIVVINGSGGVGKDTFVGLVSELLNDRVLNYSSVSAIKLLASEMGWNGEKREKDRKFLSDLKYLCSEYNDLPFKCMRKEIESFMNDDRFDILFLHIREPNEIQRVVNEFNAKAILIINNAVDDISSNSADAGVYDYPYDCYIDNSGTIDELRESAETFINSLISENKCIDCEFNITSTEMKCGRNELLSQINEVLNKAEEDENIEIKKDFLLKIKMELKNLMLENI